MKKKLVIIEDDPAIRDVLQLILEKADYAVEIYSDGNYLLKHPVGAADMFIIDKQLSGVDGLDVCRHLRNQPSTAHVPIALMSATPQMELVAKKEGIDAFIEKPFTIQYLLKIVEETIPSQ